MTMSQRERESERERQAGRQRQRERDQQHIDVILMTFKNNKSHIFIRQIKVLNDSLPLIGGALPISSLDHFEEQCKYHATRHPYLSRAKLSWFAFEDKIQLNCKLL